MPPADSQVGPGGLEGTLASRIRASTGPNDYVETTLQTDDKVLARITDGIYREPASALRELISNSYDADATRVVITTDRPRFARLVVEDDGIGMTPEALEHLLLHIGGSAKRSSDGARLGITAPDNRMLSPGGRRLIGKIGIGLFSVAQLTQSFQIITKVRGDTKRSVANINLRQFADEEADESGKKYESGLVTVWQEPAHDIDAQGTTIVINGLRPKTRETLQSAGEWQRIDGGHRAEPLYHVGWYQDPDSNQLRETAGALDRLPWQPTDSPVRAFEKLVGGVWAQLAVGVASPKLEDLLDYYLQMVWKLGLAIPAEYVDGHPFGRALSNTALFQLPGPEPGSAMAVPHAPRDTVASHLDVHSDAGTGDPAFRVVIDDLQLRRPLKVVDLPATANAVKDPMLFVGRLDEHFENVDPVRSAGPLVFEAYLLWAPKIVPVEHVGCLVRINGASGTLFDPNFFRYRRAEITRLRQISCEIFVSEGLESALNIDRETFNYAHPHVVRLINWLHNALSRSINQQKQVAAATRRTQRRDSEAAESGELQAVVTAAWMHVKGDADDMPLIRIADRPSPTSPGEYLVLREDVIGSGVPRSQGVSRIERQVKGILQLLAAFDLMDVLTLDEQQELVRYLGSLLRAGT